MFAEKSKGKRKVDYSY